MTASDTDAVASGFGDIASLLGVPVGRDGGIRQRFDALYRWFETHDSWLLLMDNADNPELFETVPLPTGDGAILITSRDEAIAAHADTYAADCLSVEDSVAALCRYANRPVPAPGSDAHESALSVALMCLPIALAQAGTYCLETQVSFAQYLERLSAQPKEMYAWTSGVRKQSLRVVAQVFPFAMEWVAERDPAAADILRSTAHLAPDDIDTTFFNDLGDKREPALALLSRFRLITMRGSGDSFDVHRLTRDVLRHGGDADARRALVETVCARVAAAYSANYKTVWDSAVRWLPHARICAEDALSCGADGNYVAGVLNQCGYELSKRGEYAAVLPLYLRALAIREEHLGANHPDTATSLNNLALLYGDFGAYDEALPLLVRALMIYEDSLGTTHPDTAQIFNNLATLYANQSAWDEALPLMVRAVEIYRTTLGVEHPNMIRLERSLAAMRADAAASGWDGGTS